MAHFYFVRHGETVMNREDRICGVTETPLTELGHCQARQAGEYIMAQGFQIDEILYSPLSRARETAAHISEVTGIPMRVEPRLIEHNFGKWEGTVSKTHPEFVAAKQRFTDDFDGGESILRVAQRVYNLLDEIMGQEKVYLLVAHGGIFRFVQSYFKVMTNEEFATSLINNCEVRRLGDPAFDGDADVNYTESR